MVGVVRQSQWKLGSSCQRQKTEMELEVSPISLGVPCDRGDRALATKPSERCPHTAPTFSGPCIWTICFFCCNLNISRPPTQIPDPHDLRHTCPWTHQTPEPRPSDIGSTRTEGTSDPPDPRTQQTLGPRTPTRRPLCLQHSGHGTQAKNQNTIMC